MVIKQVLVDFKIPPNKTEDEIIPVITNILQHHMGPSMEGPAHTATLKGFGKLFIFEDGRKSQCTVRLLPDGLVTMDLFFNVDKDENNNFIQVYYDIKLTIKESGLTSTHDVIPPITRGAEIKNYYDTSDGRIKEYDFDKIVFHETSKYQEILIVHSAQFGNMLFLDTMEMLAESDIAYTRAILGNGRETFKDKTVLILGGGDGGIIHELLKENPKFVTMVEIDRAVIDAAKIHLRKICGSSMDSFQGENYQIIVDDCLAEMRKYIEEGKTFDYVLNDLTDIPIGSQEYQEENWDFIKEVLDLSLQVLDKNGKYFAQGTNGANNVAAQDQYEYLLTSSSCPIEFKKEYAFVPSFLELWTFYEIWKKSS